MGDEDDRSVDGLESYFSLRTNRATDIYPHLSIFASYIGRILGFLRDRRDTASSLGHWHGYSRRSPSRECALVEGLWGGGLEASERRFLPSMSFLGGH